MQRGRWRTPGTGSLIAAVAGGGALAIAIAVLAYPPPLHGTVLKKALILVVLTAMSELISIRLQHGQSAELLTLFELAVVADMVLLPASVAVLVSVVGLALALVVQRKTPKKFAFNIGQYALGVVPAVAVYHGIGHGEFGSVRGLIALTAGMFLFTLINLVSISAIIAATTDTALMKVFVEEQKLSIALGLGNSAVGMVAVSLYLTRPALLPAVLAPTLALHMSFRGWVQEKELHRQMEEETNKLGRIVEHSSEGIVLADADGTVVLWSPSMERMTGVTEVEAVGKSMAYLLRGRDNFGRPVSMDVSSGGEPTDLEIVATDGSVRWLRVQHGPGFDGRGQLSFDVLVVTDVTRQREVDKLKDDFISTVSHELRTPLTPIKGYASLMLRRGDEIPPERRREALQSILERADHMHRLVEDLLLASRVANTGERRLPEVGRQAVDVGHVAEKALRSFVIAHPLREFRLEAEEGAIALGDPIRIEQIVANLVSNAIKFSDEGTPIDLEIVREGVSVHIKVRDTGRGIPADKFEEVFEKFKRLEDPLRMETGGAGLGLFIVRQLARAMGGEATVESELGKGSTFTVTLTVSSNAAAAAVAPPERRTSDLAG
ncbi:MAG TPA: ATP-binding protein [Actinomycetota bacterium]|nr:ATP-binding protein [Actinomycetota bacterium]